MLLASIQRIHKKWELDHLEQQKMKIQTKFRMMMLAQSGTKSQEEIDTYHAQ